MFLLFLYITTINSCLSQTGPLCDQKEGRLRTNIRRQLVGPLLSLNLQLKGFLDLVYTPLNSRTTLRPKLSLRFYYDRRVEPRTTPSWLKGYVPSSRFPFERTPSTRPLSVEPEDVSNPRDLRLGLYP